MSQPEQPPDDLTFFVDRSLGRVTFPALLRQAGWTLITLAEHYGVPQDQDVTDVQWIEEATRCGWPILMKDKRIRYRPAEIAAVTEHKAKCFVVTRGDLTSAVYAQRFIANQIRSSPPPDSMAHSSTRSTPTASRECIHPAGKPSPTRGAASPEVNARF